MDLILFFHSSVCICSGKHFFGHIKNYGELITFVKKKTLEAELLEEFLPGFLLDYFDIIDFKKLGDIETKAMIFEIHLDEKNEIRKDVSSDFYESKGFLPASKVQDFPIRGKALYLVIRRRRWRHKVSKREINNDYSFVSKGAKLTEDISDFLKATGRDPRGYNK